jgi:thiol:disulfide interchange protein DsbD
MMGIALCAATLLVAEWARGQSDPGKHQRKGEVTLVPSVSAVLPGQPFDVALHFRLAPGWHIYWQNSGDSGLPPDVRWTLPDGFTAGDLQYPIPKRNVAPGNIVTNVLEGEPILLVRITPPEVIGTERVALAADVRYVICKENCLRENTKLDLTFPVLAPGDRTENVNDDLFRRARRALPKEKSKYLSITAAAEPKMLLPGRPFELSVNIHIKRGFHIQSHEPLNPNFIKCDVFLERMKGVLFENAVYPPPKFRRVKYLGKVSEYAGRITVRVPGKVDAEAPGSPTRLGGILKYQACNDKGTCFPPDALAFSVPIAGVRQGAVETAKTAGLAAATSPPVESADQTAAEDAERSGFEGRFGLAGLLIACFLYGLFINATPCVLPLLSIKVLGFVQQAHESRSRTLALGLVFGVGVMLFFVVLGFLAAAGKNVLQYPLAVIGLVAVVMALALSMLGVFTLQAPRAATKVEASIGKEGLLSSFGKGALAPVLGFACTGPLLAGAFGWATQQPPYIAVFAFLCAGLGMASPYVLLGANPQWLSFLPKPGQWMITFERIMGFLLLGMAVWLLHPLITQIGAEGLEWTLGFLVATGAACWLVGKIDVTMSGSVRWKYRGVAIAIVVGAGVFIYGWIYPLGEAAARQKAIRLASYANANEVTSGIPWRLWSKEAVEKAVRSGKTVFVDVTAAYCTNCKINKGAAIYRREAIEKIKELGVIPFQGDFSDGDETIFAELQKYNRPGPPLNLIYPPGELDKPIVMNTLFSLADLLRALDRAGPSRAASLSRAGS